MSDQTKALEQFNELQAEIQIHVKPIFAVAVSSPELAASAMESARHLKSFEKKLEDRRKQLVGPHNDAVKLINSHAKKLLEPLDRATNHLKGELRKWEMLLEQEREKERKRLAEEKAKAEKEAAERAKAALEEAEAIAAFSGGGEEAERAVVLAEATAETEQAQIVAIDRAAQKEVDAMKVSGASRPWTFHIANAERVPREYLMVDEKAIRAAIRDGVREIPGVDIFQDVRISIR